MSDEHTVAIVSFQGAIKREVKRIRNKLAMDESLSEFCFEITASGRVHEGTVKLAFAIGSSTYNTSLDGDDADEVIEEFMRRRGWKARHAPKALAYEKIPSDDTAEYD